LWWADTKRCASFYVPVNRELPDVTASVECDGLEADGERRVDQRSRLQSRRAACFDLSFSPDFALAEINRFAVAI
jgi:hypothetical protein